MPSNKSKHRRSYRPALSVGGSHSRILYAEAQEEKIRACVAAVVELCQLLSDPRTAATNPTEGQDHGNEHACLSDKKGERGRHCKHNLLPHNPSMSLRSNLAELCASCRSTTAMLCFLLSHRGFTESSLQVQCFTGLDSKSRAAIAASDVAKLETPMSGPATK